MPVFPHFSQQGFALFCASLLRAVDEAPQFPRVLEQEREQNRRFIKADLSSSLERYRFRCSSFPHLSQNLSGVGTCACRIYRLLDFFVSTRMAQISLDKGNPISHLLKCGFNWPPLSIPAEQPVSNSPEAVSRAGQSVLAICTQWGRMSVLFVAITLGAAPAL